MYSPPIIAWRTGVDAFLDITKLGRPFEMAVPMPTQRLGVSNAFDGQ